MNIKNILVAVLAVVLASGCNGQNKNNAETHDRASQQTSNPGNMSKSIVIFFSHAGDNYSVG
ncbi:MAG: hypothetical protein IKN78_06945, partial [Bacteroidales bacterium]|nr:hypothetical protein [Bacteroidales bacterium]